MRAIDLVKTLNDLIQTHGEDIPVFIDYEWLEIDSVDFKLADYNSHKDRLVIR